MRNVIDAEVLIEDGRVGMAWTAEFAFLMVPVLIGILVVIVGGNNGMS